MSSQSEAKDRQGHVCTPLRRELPNRTYALRTNVMQVVVTTQMATKLFTIENKQGNFDNGDKAILMPQLGSFPALDVPA